MCAEARPATLLASALLPPVSADRRAPVCARTVRACVPAWMSCIQAIPHARMSHAVRARMPHAVRACTLCSAVWHSVLCGGLCCGMGTRNPCSGSSVVHGNISKNLRTPCTAASVDRAGRDQIRRTPCRIASVSHAGIWKSRRTPCIAASAVRGSISQARRTPCICSAASCEGICAASLASSTPNRHGRVEVEVEVEGDCRVEEEVDVHMRLCADLPDRCTCAGDVHRQPMQRVAGVLRA